MLCVSYGFSDSPKGTNFSIKYTQLAQEGTLVTSTSNHSSNTEMREDSSDINHEVKQIKSSKIGTLTEEPGHSSMDDVKKPLVKNPLSNSHFSIRFSSDIDLNEMASDETITSHPCELSKSVRDASHASMFHSRGLSSNAVAEPNGTSKELEYLGIEKQKSRTMSSSPSTANIIPFGEGDALNRNQMQIDSSLLDPTTTVIFAQLNFYFCDRFQLIFHLFCHEFLCILSFSINFPQHMLHLGRPTSF